MRPLPILSLLLLGTAACGGDDTPDPITIDVKGDRAALLAGRESGDPEWQKLTADAAGDLEFTVTKPFELVGVCEDFGGEVYAYSGGVEDADLDPYAYDIGCGAVATGAVTINLTAADSVVVNIGWIPHAVIPGIPTDLPLPLGTHDVIMVDPVTHTVAIRRGVTITNGMTLDLDFTGALPLVEHAITLSEGAVAGSALLTTGVDRAHLGDNDSSVWTLPASLIAAGDRHTATVYESDAELPRGRSSTISVDPASTATLAVTLPEYITTAAASWNGVPSVTYTAPGTWDQVHLFGYQRDDDAVPMWFYMQYAHAVRTPGSITAPDPRTVAGWKPAWNVDGAAPYELTVNLSRETATSSDRLSWTVDTTPPDQQRKRTASRTAQLERVRARIEWQAERATR